MKHGTDIFKGGEIRKPPPISIKALKAKLKTKIIGKKIFAFGQLSSTNDFAKRLAQEGGEEGTLVITDEQTKGRGRLGKSWESAPGKGLWFSMILKPNISIENAGLVSLLAGVSLAQAVEKTTTLRPVLKWPNDLLLRSKKFCGILIETDIKNNREVSFFILGIGVNVLQSKADFSDTIRPQATSLKIESGAFVDRLDLLVEILGTFEKNYLELKGGNYSFILNEWITRCPFYKKPVVIKQNDQVFEGIFEDLDAGGRLILRLTNGEIKQISCGEAIQKKEREQP
jgi:BirA family biotin operon repressor/biotin-[acetyl-CoA-carboxylase] ligase